MNTRPHCRTSPPIGIGGQPMPGGITTNSRSGFAASRPTAGFRIPSANCWISPGATMPEPIGSAAELQTDDRRTARMGLVGDGRAAGVRNVAADYQALAPSTPSSCRSRARWLVMPYALEEDVSNHRFLVGPEGQYELASCVPSPARANREICRRCGGTRPATLPES